MKIRQWQNVVWIAGAGLLYCTGNLPTVSPPNTDGIVLRDYPHAPFQDSALQGAMSAASASLGDVETGSVVGCSGGLDCIPQYSYPEIISAEAAGYVQEDELVAGVSVNGQARAYPLSTFWTHEIANDTVGGVAMSVNYCPLTGTALNFKGEIGGKVATFGVSGRLFNNNLILYDHQTQSFWPQMLFTAAWGAQKNTQIRLMPVHEMTWKAWRALFPTTTVVSSRYQSSRYPYGDYYTNHGNILFPQYVDPRLKAKDLVLGVIGPRTARVYPFKSMGTRRVTQDVLDGEPILVVFDAEAAAAVAFVRPSLNGKVLEFSPADSSRPFPFELTALGVEAVWDFAGRGLSGQAVGKDLTVITTAFKGFWLSWGAYYRDCEIYGEFPLRSPSPVRSNPGPL